MFKKICFSMLAVMFLFVIAVSHPVLVGEPPGSDSVVTQVDQVVEWSDECFTLAEKGALFVYAMGEDAGYDSEVVLPPDLLMASGSLNTIEEGDRNKNGAAGIAYEREDPLIQI